MSENVSAEAQEYYPASVGSVMGDTYTGYYVVCSCQANEYGDGPRIPAREYPAHLAAHQPARVTPSVEEVCAVTREHTIRDRQPYGWGCWGCDWTGDSAGHATHVGDAVLALYASQPTVAEVREQVARELEALLPTDDEVADPRPCSAGHDCHEAARYVTVRRAQRIARGETKGGE